MDDREILNEFCEFRFDHAFEKRLSEDVEYKLADSKATEKLEEVLHLLTSKEQQVAVDELVEALNYTAVLYGHVAYAQGFQDGVQLLMDILQIHEKTKLTEYSK